MYVSTPANNLDCHNSSNLVMNLLPNSYTYRLQFTNQIENEPNKRLQAN